VAKKSKYVINFYKGSYLARQRQANKDQCICYIEHHFNASESLQANYTLALIGSNASQTSHDMADYYTDLIEQWLEIPQYGRSGVKKGGFNGRGDYNLRYTNMPAVLLEPLFASTPDHAEVLVSEPGRQRLAEAIVNTIRKYFPKGGTVGFSIGHKYKTSRPNDRGAAVHGKDPDPNDNLGHTEADYAEAVLMLAAQMLTSGAK